MKRFLFLILTFATLIGIQQNVHAQEETIHFDLVEQSLFPSWRGSESVPENMEQIIQRMTPAEKEELLQHQLEIQKQQLRVTQALQDLEAEKREFDKYTQSQNTFKGNAREAEIKFEDCVRQKGRPQCQQEEEEMQRLIEEAQKTDTDAPDRYADKQHRYADEQQKLREQQLEYQNFLSRWHNLNMLPQGVIGFNCDGNFLLDYMPIIVRIIFSVIAPIVLVMILYAGIQFIYNGDDPSALEGAKMWFIYASIGILLIILSYSIMKATYFIFSTTEEAYQAEQYQCREFFTPTEYLEFDDTQPQPSPTPSPNL